MLLHRAAHPALAALALILGALPLANALAAPRETKAQVQAILWGKEQAIYAARGHGDLKPYLDAVARDYLAWPPFRTAPAGAEGLHELQGKMAQQTQEQLEMRFVALSLNGDAAVIYYQTHRTRLPDGTPANERFDVVHSWVRENGTWKVLGGMARERKE